MRFAGSRNNVDFTPPSLGAAASGGNYGAAAGMVDLGTGFANIRKASPSFDELAAATATVSAQERAAAMNAEANVMAAGLQSYGQTKGNALLAEASIEAAEKQAEGQKQSSIFGGLGQVASAGIGLISTLSDETTKTGVKTIDTALEKLRNLRPVTFYYKEEFGDPERLHHGFIAQEFHKVLPDATYVDENNGRMSIDPIDVIGLLVRANQELEERIGALEAKQALATV